MELELKVTIAIIAGLFSLLGAFAGAFLARRTQYEKWLREQRSEVYAQFLTMINEARKKASDILYDNQLNSQDKNIKVTENYSIPLDYGRIVRLYLPKSHRDEFEKLARQICALHADPDLGDKRFQSMTERLDKIQDIFENNL